MDDKIKEVMGLVDELVGESMAGGMCSIATNPDVAKQAPDFAKSIATLKSAIESKLRELVTVWLPIESAPRDGSCILLRTAYGLVEGYWKYDQWEQDVIGSSYDMSYPRFECEPTNWMPLP